MPRMQRWWEVEPGDMAQSLMGAFAVVSTAGQGIQELNMRHLRLYGDLTTGNMDLYPSIYARGPEWYKEKLTWNVVQSVVDAAAAKIAQSRPKPTFLTTGGDFLMQRKARKLDQFCRGVFYKADVYAKMPSVFKDAAVMGTGIGHVYSEGDELCFERVFPGEIYVDELEAINGYPRQLFRSRWVDKGQLIARFPEYKEEILDCASKVEYYEAVTANAIADRCRVVEAWHLPSGPNAEDGKHVVAIDTCLLSEKPWKRKTFPFVFYRWNTRIRGFWGQGIAEQLTGIQIEINVSLRRVQKALNLMANPRTYVERGSKIVRAQLNNEEGAVIEYTGSPPIQATPPAVNPQLLQHLETQFARAYELPGISALFAQSKKPVGLESGEALRTYSGIGDSRFSLPHQGWDKAYMDISRLFIEEARASYLDGVDIRMEAPNNGRTFVESIKWSEVDLDADAYVMQVFPSSSLPTEPAGRKDAVRDLMVMGMIDAQTGRRLLDYPDLEAENSLARSTEDVADKIIEDLLEGREADLPEPYFDLNTIKPRVLFAYQRACADGAPEEVKEAFRDWLNKIDSLIALATQPAPMGMEGITPAPAPTPSAEALATPTLA